MTFKLINIKKERRIKYSELRIKRSGNGWDTDCYSYNLDNNIGYYRMRSDCVNDCYQDKMREMCKVDRGLFMSSSLIRRDYLNKANDKMISCDYPGYNREIFSIKKDCVKMCKVECSEKYYLFEIEEIDSISNYSKNFMKIQHSKYPDIFVNYIPELNFIKKSDQSLCISIARCNRIIL